MIQMVYKGDMDNNTFGPNGEILPEQKWLGVIGRRERVALLIYVWTLFPALVVDDLGPVLSLTGSIGASCLAYTAPGLVYLGINGVEFLQYVDELLQRKGFPAYSATAAGSEMELPVVGNANAHMINDEDDKEARASSSSKRPWWWWVGGFPLWVYIAQNGADGVQDFLENAEHPPSESQRAMNTHRPHHESHSIEIGPNVRDFWVSIMLISFGFLALVVGVACNIYVQIHSIFYSPA
jgi:hypothetical protein